MIQKYTNDDRRGQIFVLFVAALLVLFSLVMLAIDVGFLSHSLASLKNSADAASLAAMLEHYEVRANGESRSSAREAGTQEAQFIADVNYSGVGCEVTWGRWENDEFVAYDTAIPANAAKVRVFRNKNAPGGPINTFFAGMIGWGEVEQEAEAVAHFEHPAMVPFVVYEGDVASVGEEMKFYNDTEVAPGVAGLLDFNGGEKSATELKEWTKYGWDGDITIDPSVGYLKVEGSPGLKSALAKPVADHIKTGQTLVGCVYDKVEGEGSDATFYVVGYVSIVVTDQKLVDEEYEYIQGKIKGVYHADSGQSEGAMRDTVRLHLSQ